MQIQFKLFYNIHYNIIAYKGIFANKITSCEKYKQRSVNICLNEKLTSC